MKVFLRKFFLLLMCAIASGYLSAQQSDIHKKDIPYYEVEQITNDTLILEKCKLDLYYPKYKKDFATIIWFHGGGLTSGSKRQLPLELLDKGYAVVSVGYRLSPKVNAPAYIEDAAAAVAWVFKHIPEYGGNSRLIFLSGHSAGAYLNLMITLDKKYLQRYKIDADSIAGVVPLSPQVITHFTVRKERGRSNLQPAIDEFAPLNFVRKGAPKILLVTGDPEMELLGRYEENAYFWRMMKLAGDTQIKLYKLDGFDHGSMAIPGVQLLLKAVREICSMRK